MIIKKPIQYAIITDKQGDCGVFDTMNDAIQSAYAASEQYSKYEISRKTNIIDSVINVLQDNLEELSLMMCKEVGVNSYNDVLYKNSIALNNFKNYKLFENKLNSNKINDCETSYVVNGVIVQPSNAIETLIKYSILMLSSGNTVVFSSNKSVKNVFSYAVKLINNAIQDANGPKNLIVTVKKPSIENTSIMIEHELITPVSTVNTNTIEKIAL